MAFSCGLNGDVLRMKLKSKSERQGTETPPSMIDIAAMQKPQEASSETGGPL